MDLLEKIAIELDISIGRLLYPHQNTKITMLMDGVDTLVADCSQAEIRIMRDMILALKLSLRRSGDY